MTIALDAATTSTGHVVVDTRYALGAGVPLLETVSFGASARYWALGALGAALSAGVRHVIGARACSWVQPTGLRAVRE